jgi:hypothetical protein
MRVGSVEDPASRLGPCRVSHPNNLLSDEKLSILPYLTEQTVELDINTIFSSS